MPNRVAYLVSRFPKISETFILREMIALRDNGWDIVLYPLILENQAVVHADAKPWMNTLRYYPWFSRDVLVSNIRAFWRRPKAYISLWIKMAYENLASVKFLARAIAIFPKAICMAEDMVISEVDHIHAHFATHPALTAWLVHRWSGISYSVTAHAHDIYVDQTMLATKLKDATLIITISEFNREFLTQKIGRQIIKKIKIVHCGVDQARYSISNTRKQVERFKICSIGSLEKYKGMRFLVEACTILRDRNIDFECQIVGGGEEYVMLDDLIAQHSMQDRVKLLGARPQEDVAQILQQAHCYVQPSVITETGKMEGIPVAIMEALSCALPVVASNISGIPELVRHKETGYLVPPANPSILADAIEYIYYHQQEAAELGQAGRGLVLKEFTIENSAACIVELFSVLIKS